MQICQVYNLKALKTHRDTILNVNIALYTELMSKENTCSVQREKPFASSQPHFIITFQLVVGKALHKQLTQAPTSFLPLPCPGLNPALIPSLWVTPVWCQVVAASLLCSWGCSPETLEPGLSLLLPHLGSPSLLLKVGQNKNTARFNTPLPGIFTSRGSPPTAAPGRINPSRTSLKCYRWQRKIRAGNHQLLHSKELA